MTTYRLFPSTNGPATPASYGGDVLLGVMFSVSEDMWFDGYWWWVAPSGQSTAAQKFALWGLTGTGVGTLIPGSVVTSGTLTAGQWNYVPLATPIPLSLGAPYCAATGLTGNFPDTTNQFGTGDPYASGITNGPLLAYSDGGSSNPVPYNTPQGVFSTAGNDPSVNMPGSGSAADNFWVDVQVDTQPPASVSSYRLWPNYPVPLNTELESALNFTLATEFKLTQACKLDKIWFYSPSGSTQLPTECGIWDVSTQALVAGTDNAAPTWSGAAGSGWISCSYTGITLPPGDYKTSVFNGAASPTTWASNTIAYFDTGAGASGVSSGPLSAPNETNATAPGQGSWHQGLTFHWPDTYTGAPNEAQTYWVDVEVTPVVPASGMLLAAWP